MEATNVIEAVTEAVEDVNVNIDELREIWQSVGVLNKVDVVKVFVACVGAVLTAKVVDTGVRRFVGKIRADRQVKTEKSA